MNCLQIRTKIISDYLQTILLPKELMFLGSKGMKWPCQFSEDIWYQKATEFVIYKTYLIGMPGICSLFMINTHRIYEFLSYNQLKMKIFFTIFRDASWLK